MQKKPETGENQAARRHIGHAGGRIQKVERIENDESEGKISERDAARNSLRDGENNHAADRATESGQKFSGDERIVDPSIWYRGRGRKKWKPKTKEKAKTKPEIPTREKKSENQRKKVKPTNKG